MAHITKFNAFGFRLQLKHVHDLIHKFVEAHFITMQIKLTGFNFGDIQQAFIEFGYVCHSRLPEYVSTDEKRLRQVLINLLHNAIKFTQTGKVGLEVRYRNQVAEFVVWDTGIGISESDVERIFKPFERVREPGMAPVSGTGLGLTITRLLVEIMGGD